MHQKQRIMKVFQSLQLASRSRKAKGSNRRNIVIFRGLRLKPDEEIGVKGRL